MSRSVPASKKPENYHHGNLRQALLLAAHELATEVGVDGFTLREVARRAGVSHAAPYHHFSDKATLVRALASEAFKQLTQAMLESKRSQKEPLAALKATGMGYIKFALAFPSDFRFMFRCEPGTQRSNESDEFQQVSGASYQVLLDAILECQTAGLLSDNDPQVMAMSAWSLVHGLASIILDGPLGPQHQNLEQVEPLAEGVLRTLMQGLELRSNQ